MKILNIIVLSTVVMLLTGCGTMLNGLAYVYDSNDHCQLRNNGGNVPSYCGATANRTYIYATPKYAPYAPLGATAGYIQK